MASRRDVLAGGFAAGLLGSGLLRFGAATNSATNSATERDTVLITVELHGGNDGLSTVLPLEQERWYQLRPTLSQVARGSHPLAPGWGLHPSLPQLAAAFAEGELAIVHGVGTPVPERSHFHALELWHRGTRVAREERDVREGWLGRAGKLAGVLDAGAPTALYAGGDIPPLSLYEGGQAPATWGGRSGGAPVASQALAEAQVAAAKGRTHELVAHAREHARRLGERIARAEGTPLLVPWPASGLATDLARVARAVHHGWGPRVYGVVLGGFDTHLEQAASHERLLAELDGALGALRAELSQAGWWSRTAVVVHSEFGRRAAENQSRGTDHGNGAPVLLLGGALGGGLYGTAPDLEQLVDGDVPATTDLTHLQSTLVSCWLEGAGARVDDALRRLFPGG